jgi:pyrimidine-nucleoside phosphorylase
VGSPWSFDPRDVVARKRDDEELSAEEIRSFVLGFARGEVPDYLASAFLMAVYVNGLSDAETAEMTRAMVESGATLPLSRVTSPKVDKHSTGGVSDGVTLIFAPLAASLGLAVAKLSGRGLGHTGGTLDKLESIPGLRTDLTLEQLERQVQEVGCAVAGQSKDLVPADGALYALRDATATVASVPLIAASVMSKKLAVGSDLILLDVKAGSGAFMKTPDDAGHLASACVGLAEYWGRATRAAVTDMSQPLGSAIGNALEVAEAVRVLKGEQGGRLRELAVAFAGEALAVLEGRDRASARTEAERALDGALAAERFARMVDAQGGDPGVVDDPWRVLPRTDARLEVRGGEGFLASVDCEALGRAAASLGAGRVRKSDPIDPAVGIEFLPKIGDRIDRGAVVAIIHARDPRSAEAGAERVRGAMSYSQDPVEAPPVIIAWYGQEAPARNASEKAQR